MATNPETKAVVKAPVTSGNQLAAFVPQSLDEAWRLAGALAASGMCPKAYGTDQNKVMVGILAGAELGLTPFAALQSIAVIGNNPAVWGDGMLGLVEASGKLQDIEETDDGTTATCRVVRVGRPTPIVRTFSVEDAKKAGLAGKSGPWSQYPARMRQMRARAFALRDAFSDVLRGMKSAEEVRDYAPMDGGQLKSQPAKISAATLIEQAAEPVQDEAQEGRAEADHGDQHDDTLDDHPMRGKADDMILRLQRAEVFGDIIAIEAEFAGHKAATPDEIVAEVERAIDTAKRRVRGEA
jgi:hypothetical protein